MNDYISPIDRHRHFGDAGRAECAVCCLEADRDRLRDAWTVEHDAADAAAAAVGNMAAKLSTLLADNERLEDELAVYRDQALPDAATIMNGLADRDPTGPVAGGGGAGVELG